MIVHQKGQDAKEKLKLTFLKLFDNENIFLKKFLACNGYFGFAKIKKIDCGAHFLHDVSTKCSLFTFLSIKKVLMTYIFPFQE